MTKNHVQCMLTYRKSPPVNHDHRKSGAAQYQLTRDPVTLSYGAVDAQHLGFSDVGDAVAVVVDPPRGLVVCGVTPLKLVVVEAICEIIRNSAVS